jgi:hypothetical protein
VAPFTDVSAQIARCGPGYKDGSALCDTGYASVAGVCTKCEDKAGHIIVPLVLFPIILVLIQRITGHFESTEISLAFLQFLGVFAGFGVRWAAGFQTFLDLFSIANVDVDLLGLACGEIEFQTMWTIQAILLPLLYLAFVIVDVAAAWILLQAAKARIGPVMFMIKKGWRPTRSFALSSISDRYLPHGLMYLNIYYLTGVSKALVLLQCESAGDGSKPYLAADPTLPCWEGTHAKIMGLNVISLLLYVLLVPLGYAYILFRRCPKEGLRSPRLYNVFGFLWGRFEDRCYWWEVAEITLRKLPLVIISIFVPGAIYKCMVGILLIGALMAFNYVKEPYTLYRHDLLDQMVSTAEVLLFLFGILAEYRAEGELAGSGGFVDEAPRRLPPRCSTAAVPSRAAPPRCHAAPCRCPSAPNPHRTEATPHGPPLHTPLHHCAHRPTAAPHLTLTPSHLTGGDGRLPNHRARLNARVLPAWHGH